MKKARVLFGLSFLLCGLVFGSSAQSNREQTKAAKAAEGVNLKWTFDDEASFTADWGVESFHSSETAKWHWADKSADEAEHGGLCMVGVDESLKTDINEWLYLRNKVTLKAGKAFLRFQRKLASWKLPVLTVYYGETYTSKEAGLTSIKQMSADMSSVQQWQTWQQEEIEFNVATDGDYIFVFSLYMEGVGETSSSYSGAPFYLDNIEVIQEPAPDPLDVPVSFTFDDAESFAANWKAQTADADGTTWTWQTASYKTPSASDGNTGYVGTGSNSSTNLPKDYLFTKAPVKLSAGKATFDFDWYSMNWSDNGLGVIKVFYGKQISMDAANLTEIGSVTCSETESWQKKSIEFDVAEAGNYHFCIYVTMNDEGWKQELLFIDNVKINQETEPTPEDLLDLVLDELVLPASSLTLGNAETIGVKVTNKGTVEITKMTLTYAVNNGTPVEQAFEETLAANASTTLTFTEKADFSAAGTYTIVIKVKAVEASTSVEQNPEGDSIGGTVTHLAPQTLPYSCGFDNREEFETQWISLCHTQGKTKGWDWYAKNLIDELDITTADFKEGYVASQNTTGYNDDYTPRKTANYLITASPITLPAEKNIVVNFKYRRSHGSSELGNLLVFYGTSAEVGENQEGLTLIGQVNGPNDLIWHEGNLEFEVTEAGQYYLFFKHEAVKTFETFFVLDDISVAEGTFVGTPDLKVNSVELPLPSCALSNAESIVAEVENLGTATITKFKMTYTVNDGTAVEQEFSDTLVPEAKKKLTFNTKADFSTKAQYAVKVTAQIIESNGKDEENTDNNSASASVAYRTPATLPFEADFTKNADERNKMVFASGTWAYDAPRKGMTTATVAVLQSPCLPFEADATYRIYLTYRSYVKNPDFDVLCGLASEPMSDWDTVKAYHAVNTEGDYKTDVLEFHNGDAAGDYAFAVMPRNPENGTYSGGLYVQSVKVDRKPDYDIQLVAIRSTLGAQTPVQHAQSPKFEILAKNFGEKNAANIKVTVKNGETLVGESEPISLTAGDSTYCSISGELNLASAGEVSLSVEAVLEGSAENQPENARNYTFTATNEDYAFDDISFTDYGRSNVGIRNTPVGHVFTLAETDTLTHVTLGWADLTGNEYGITESFDVNVEVYPIDNAGKVGNALLNYVTERPLSGGVKTVKIPSRVLKAGRYFIGVRQTDPRGSMALGCDMQANGRFYVIEEGQMDMEEGLGYVAVRARFGHDLATVGKDIEMLSIRKPGSQGAYSANEAIVAEYRNNGCDSMQVEFKCTVIGQTQSKTIKVSGYSAGSVEFEADLSRAGSYGILIEAVAEGDEDASNNTVRKTVTCVEADPYVMDFELCGDFAIEDLLPWHTQDVDGARTSGLDGYHWPHYGESMGFMAFSPAEVSMEAIVPAHGGDKFGMAISSIGKQNDDWLISPKLKMAADKAAMTYFVRAYHPAYTETYEVLVSTTNNEIASFVRVGESRSINDTSWTENTIDLSAYNGQEIYIAFRYTAKDQFFFMLDDINVTKPGQGTGTETVDLSASVKSYPNPVSDVWTVTAYGTRINHVVLYNLSGNVVWRSANRLNTESLRLNMGRFAAGLYTAHVYTEAGLKVMKVIVR